MGALFGKKKEETLRPLTEKEIQQKLYGEFHSRETLKVKTESEPEPVDIAIEEALPTPTPIPVSPSRKPVFTEPPGRKTPLRPSFQREKVVAFFRNTLLGFLNFWKKLFLGSLGLLKTILTKAGTGWGVSILIVTSLFLAIHALNSYRTRGMSSSKSLIPSLPLKSLEPARLSPRSQPSVLSSEPPASSPAVPPPPRQAPAPQRAAATDARYVVQVAIYLREEDALKVASRIAAARFPAFVEPLRRTGGGRTLYPVFLGRFSSLREAQTQLREFRKQPISKDFPDSFVRSL